MGLLDRVVGGRLVPPPELEPPEAAELRLVAGTGSSGELRAPERSWG